MKNKIILIIAFLCYTVTSYASPLAGVSGISSDTERALTLASILEKHILGILKNNSFSVIQPDIISRELARFNCIEEKCVLKFADDADIDLLVTGTVTDRKKYIVIRLESFGIKIPFNQRIISRYEVKIPMDVNIGSREFSLISEEHAAEFIARTLKLFLTPVYITKSEEKFVVQDNLKLNGRYNLYKLGSDDSAVRLDQVDIIEGVIDAPERTVLSEQYFILRSYAAESRSVSEFYTKRKNEIVFGKTSYYDTLFILALLPAASASMPLSSPLLGYYMNDDWPGFGLWMINAPPYLYMEARGFINSPDNLKKRRESISRDDRAMNYFAWYMLLAGGMPLFVDSYNYNYLHQASYFKGSNNLLGNSATAALLSLTSNGAGLFYRGDRFWGYFYFHLNNILLYAAIREFSAPEIYNESTHTYSKGNVNKKRGIVLGSVLAVSKTIEVVHSILKKENISSGIITDEYVIPSPLFTVDDNGDPQYGISITAKF